MNRNNSYNIAPGLLHELLAEARINQHDQPPPETVVFRIDFQNIGSFGNFTLLTGLPKAGKGKYLAGFTAAALTRAEIFSLSVKLPAEKNKVQYWDTEQSRHDHFQHINLIRKLADLDDLPATYHSYHCRKHDAQTILAMIEHELAVNPDTGLVILDGLLDLIDSFNDEKQSKMLVNFLKRITDVYNLLVMAVLHRSKSVDKSVGHLGSAADRAAQSVLIVEKNREAKQYVLKPEYLRNADTFNPIAIHYNKQLELWEQCEVFDGTADKPRRMPRRKPAELDIMEHTLHVGRIFNSQALQPYKMLIQNIQEVYGEGRNWAVECVKYLTTQTQLLFKTADGYTCNKEQKIKLFIEK